MKIVVDLIGTFDREKEQLSRLMRELVKHDNQVYLLCCNIKGTPTKYQYEQQAKKLGLVKGFDYTELVVLESESEQSIQTDKGLWCRNNWIDIVFEDDDSAILNINQLSPFTSTWLLRRFA